jgi:hypothetical protein
MLLVFCLIISFSIQVKSGSGTNVFQSSWIVNLVMGLSSIVINSVSHMYLVFWSESTVSGGSKDTESVSCYDFSSERNVLVECCVVVVHNSKVRGLI